MCGDGHPHVCADGVGPGFAAEKHHYVCLEWQNGHSSAFHGEWLHDNKYDDERVLCNSTAAMPTIPSTPFKRRVSDGHPPSLQRFDYDGVIARDDLLMDWLECIVKCAGLRARCHVPRPSLDTPLCMFTYTCRDGAALVTGTPHSEDSVIKLSDRISAVQRTIYGTTFQVIVRAIHLQAFHRA